MFAPVNARVDACGHVVIFDGNHRATAHALAFGVAELMPVMIWDIPPGKVALSEIRTPVSLSDRRDTMPTKPIRPNTTQLLSVLVRLHDDVRQVQYPYSSKVLKWGIISESELIDAQQNNPQASEQDVWEGLQPPEVAARLAGGQTDYLDQAGLRAKWVSQGMSEGSWKVFLSTYCYQKAATVPFDSDDYYRGSELENLRVLAQIMDDEIFSSPKMLSTANRTATFKTKWWKECHRVFADALTQDIYYGLNLPSRPTDGVCYTPAWPKEVQIKVRDIAKRWAKSPLWDQPDSITKGVDFRANNELNVKTYLAANNFTSAYLEGR